MKQNLTEFIDQRVTINLVYKDIIAQVKGYLEYRNNHYCISNQYSYISLKESTAKRFLLQESYYAESGEAYFDYF